MNFLTTIGILHKLREQSLDLALENHNLSKNCDRFVEDFPFLQSIHALDCDVIGSRFSSKFRDWLKVHGRGRRVRSETDFHLEIERLCFVTYTSCRDGYKVAPSP